MIIIGDTIRKRGIRRERDVVQDDALQDDFARSRAGGHIPLVYSTFGAHTQHLHIRLRPKESLHPARVSFKNEGIVKADGGVHLHNVAVDRSEQVTAVTEANCFTASDGDLVHRQQVIDQDAHETQLISETNQTEQSHRM